MTNLDSNKFIMTESVKVEVDSVLSSHSEELSETEIVNLLNNSGKFLVRLTESGQYSVKQVLNG